MIETKCARNQELDSPASVIESTQQHFGVANAPSLPTSLETRLALNNEEEEEEEDVAVVKEVEREESFH